MNRPQRRAQVVRDRVREGLHLPVGPFEFGGALADPLLQQAVVQREDLLLGVAPGRDVAHDHGVEMGPLDLRDHFPFGQPMPEGPMMRADEETHKCDLFLVLGSSLVVTPAAHFPVKAKRNGARLVILWQDLRGFLRQPWQRTLRSSLRSLLQTPCRKALVNLSLLEVFNFGNGV